MANNILNASVPVTLDGAEFTLRYRALAFIRYAEECKSDLLNDIRRIGKEHGKMQQAFDDPEAETTGPGVAGLLSKLRDMLWAGLIDAHPNIKRDDVARMIDFRNLGAIFTAITEGIKRTTPEIDATSPPAPRVNHLPSLPAAGPDSGAISETTPESQPPNSAN